MDENQIVKFPRYVDKPKMIGIFEMDEAVIGMIPMFITILYGLFNNSDSSLTLMLGFVLWFITGILVHKFKKNNPNGFMYHYAYRIGFYHPIKSNPKLKVTRKDIRDGRKIIPTGIVKVFIN